MEWHPQAEGEFDADIDWYEAREVGVGDRFEVEVLAAVDESAGSPAAWAIWPGWDRDPVVRSKGVHNFPYRVVYFVEEGLVTIVAVAHTKRRPGYWQNRV
ncbi:type II toxin-antitoxin system RelE/ParE family toxin [Ornithinimicrobium faecis]|uniref:type II toxin-antitoxin system RelE/ParE family toxin n=1 Tax=Ornithinimicrobium faecis TaxID=2934158 RepID=UPI00211753EB|nr:type II toxin-antitoxin system RelE/ParE family toxin [Ornithinimicrobium sp. HY1745]